jgi:uncharacterized membrane protein HdeD (DUF308 family)
MSQGSLLAGIEAARRNWGWFLVLGVLLIVLGAVTLGMPFLFSVVYVWFWGISLLVASVFYFVGLFAVRSWEGFFIYLLLGLLSLFVGLFCVLHPVEAEVQLTLVLAILLIVGGTFRAFSAAFLQYPGFLWTVLGGLIALVLGLLVYQRWPSTGLWFIGMMVSIDLMIQGASWVGLALALKTAPLDQGTTAPPTSPPAGTQPRTQP